MGLEDSGSKRVPDLPRQAEHSSLGSALWMTPNVVVCSAGADDQFLPPVLHPSWVAPFREPSVLDLKGPVWLPLI